jgi:outer membrane biosynthesis protein TonB
VTYVEAAMGSHGGSRNFVLGAKPAVDAAARYGIAISIALHLALLIVFAFLLSSGPIEMRRPPTRMIRAELIAPVARQAQPASRAPAPAAPAAPELAQKPTPTPKPKPRPAPPKAQPPAPAQKAQSDRSPATQAASPVAKEQQGIEPESAENQLLGRLRTNWLAPPRTAASFSCRLRIDYRPGGMISKVTVQQGCGEPGLGDSIERAVWKSQPLPLAPDAPPSGSIELDFSP